jgi:hypothetical protein
LPVPPADTTTRAKRRPAACASPGPGPTPARRPPATRALPTRRQLAAAPAASAPRALPGPPWTIAAPALEASTLTRLARQNASCVRTASMRPLPAQPPSRIAAPARPGPALASQEARASAARDTKGLKWQIALYVRPAATRTATAKARAAFALRGPTPVPPTGRPASRVAATPGPPPEPPTRPGAYAMRASFPQPQLAAPVSPAQLENTAPPPMWPLCAPCAPPARTAACRPPAPACPAVPGRTRAPPARRHRARFVPVARTSLRLRRLQLARARRALAGGCRKLAAAPSATARADCRCRRRRHSRRACWQLHRWPLLLPSRLRLAAAWRPAGWALERRRRH